MNVEGVKKPGVLPVANYGYLETGFPIIVRLEKRYNVTAVEHLPINTGDKTHKYQY